VHAAAADGLTALHLAAREGQTAVVQLLLDAQANINSADEENETPVYCAAANGHTEAAADAVCSAD
jgi:ankyrin repeat protein